MAGGEEHPLLERAREAPEAPGVYRFLDARGTVLYVGKARNLRRRVLSYFTRGELAQRTEAMLERARGLDVTVTASEVEAFILENTLIKRHKPRFNVTLRDDKTYPYLKITSGETWPRVEYTRKVRNDGHSYFGPFMGQHMARRLMDLARTHFQVRTCRIEIDGSLPRPCLYYHMHACLGPCVDGLTTPEAYAEAVEELRLFLSGDYNVLTPRLESSMWRAAEQEAYERAGKYRDLIEAVRRLGEQQSVEMPGKGDADVVAVHADGEHATVCVLPYRDGKLVDKREFHFEGIGDVRLPEVLSTFAAQYYATNPAVPPQLETSVRMPEDERKLLEAYLAHRRGRAAKVLWPQRGPRMHRMKLARENARAAFELRFRAPRSQARHLERRLGEALELDSPVHRIEAFDISHASGSHTLASCVVWIGGRMTRKEYRSFNIKGVDGVDDFASIAEAVERRYRRRKAEGLELPDVVLIDGGLGQLNAARAAIDAVGVGEQIGLASLAKREELVYLPGRDEPLRLDDSDPALLTLRQIRDEAHRFAVTRMRRRQRSTTLHSQLLNLPGVGPARSRELIKRFGSVAGVQRATLEELQAELGPRIGLHVFQHLHAGERPSGERERQ
jgi:excinuclease ABC subunit C